jgi:hypothetical protein
VRHSQIVKGAGEGVIAVVGMHADAALCNAYARSTFQVRVFCESGCSFNATTTKIPRSAAALKRL